MPRWSPRGTELFYVAPGGRMMSVPIRTTQAFGSDEPRLLFVKPYLGSDSEGHSYDVADDGRFLAVKRDVESSAYTELRVVRGWLDAVAAPARQ